MNILYANIYIQYINDYIFLNEYVFKSNFHIVKTKKKKKKKKKKRK